MYLNKTYKEIQTSLEPFYERARKTRIYKNLDKKTFQFEKAIHREKVLEHRKLRTCYADYPRPLCKADPAVVESLAKIMGKKLRQLIP